MTDQAPAPAGPRKLLPLLGLVFLFLPLVILFSRLDWPGHIGDDAAYVGAAKGMSTYSGYAEFARADVRPETKHPPGYPLLLLPTFWSGLAGIHAYQAVTAVFGLATLGLLWLYPAPFGPLVAVLTLFNFYWLLFCQQIMSEIPYGFFLLVVALALRRGQDSTKLESTPRVIIGLILGFSVLCRTIGVAVIPVGMFILWRRKVPWTQWLPVPIYAALVAAPFYFFSAVTGYREDVAGYPGLLVVLKTNALYYLQALPFFLGVSADPIRLEDPGWAVVTFLFLALLSWGCWIAVGKGLAFESLSTLALGAVLMIWPFQDVRLMVPMIPLFLMFALIGGAEALERAQVPKPQWWVFGLLLAAELWRLTAPVAEAWNSKPPYARPPIMAAIDQLKKPGDVVVGDDQGVWLQCGTPVFPLAPEVRILKLYEAWMESMSMVDARFLLLAKHLDQGRSLSMGEARSSSEGKLLKTVLNLPNTFKLVGEDERYMLFEITVDWKKEREAAGWFRLGHQKFFTQKSGAEEFRKALAIDPAFPVARFFLANLLLQQGKVQEAATQLETLLRYQPYFDDAAALLAQLRAPAPGGPSLNQ